MLPYSARILIALTLVLLTAHCSGTAPTPQIIIVTGEGTPTVNPTPRTPLPRATLPPAFTATPIPTPTLTPTEPPPPPQPRP